MGLERRVEGSLAALGVHPDEPIGVACSGGADSIALMHLVAQRPDVHVLHVDHQLRDDSRDDAEFVREEAGRLGVPFRAWTVVVNTDGVSIEAAAREMRYEMLGHMAREAGLRYVLTAHTLDDQAETVLLRLMRGGSVRGIEPVLGIFVRPLLDVRRDDLGTWLVQRDIAWREDPSNLDTRFERNWVRHVLLPQMQERRPGVTDVIARTASRTRDDDRALDALATDVVDASEADDAGIFVRHADLLMPAIATRVIRTALRKLGVDPSEHDVATVRSAAGHVSCGHVDVWRLPDGFAFLRTPLPVPDPVELPRSGELASRRWGIKVRTDIATDSRLLIRTRRPGDRVRTRAGSRKVQDVLVDAKVPRPLRAFVPILADDNGALAVICGELGASESGTLQTGGLFEAEPFEQTWSRAKVWGAAWVS